MFKKYALAEKLKQYLLSDSKVLLVHFDSAQNNVGSWPNQ